MAKNAGNTIRLSAKAALVAAPDAIVIFDHRERCLDVNPAAEMMFGFDRATVLGQTIADLILPARLRETCRLSRQLNTRIEQVFRRADGEEFPAEIHVVPLEIDGVSGADPVFAGFIRDITDRKHAEQRHTLLLNEINHRSNNLLTVVQAIVQRTLRDYPPDVARTIIDRRITALSRSHTGLANSPVGAPLAAIVSGEVEGFSNRVHATGPEVLLKAGAAQTMALIIHELATNAIKHGALSSDAGKIDVDWAVSGGDAAVFLFDWREHAGPLVTPPMRTGFGRTVLEQIAADEFHVAPQMTFAPNGVTYRLETRLSAVSDMTPTQHNALVNDRV